MAEALQVIGRDPRRSFRLDGQRRIAHDEVDFDAAGQTPVRELREPLPVRAMGDELVKDPVCHTYVVRSRAISREAASGPAYFCSAECARRYAAQV